MKIYQISFLILLLGLGACTDQDTPSVSNTTPRTVREQQVFDNCENFSPSTNLLTKQNVLNLFQCQNWNPEFPNLVNTISNIPENQWNHIWVPIQKYFYDDVEKRNEFISLVIELDEKGGLDDLSEVLKSTMESNFWTTADRILGNIEDGNETTLTKEEFKNILRLLNSHPKALSNVSFILSSLNFGLYKNMQNFRPLFAEQVQKDGFNKLRIELVDAFFNEIRQKTFDRDEREILIHALSFKEANKDYSFIHEWLLSYQAQDVEKFVYDHLEKYPNWRINLSRVVETYPTIRCNENYLVDMESDIDRLIQSMIQNSQADFFRDIHSSAGDLLMANEVCQFKTMGQKVVDPNLIFKATLETLKNPKHFQMASFLQSTYLKFAPNDLLKFGNLFSTELFSKSLPFLDYLIKEKGNNLKHLVEVGLDLFKDYDPNFSLGLANLVYHYFDDEFLTVIQSLGKLWNLFTPVEKQYFFDIFDTHFKDNQNTELILHLYAKLIKEFEDLFPYLAQHYASNEDQLETTFNAIRSYAHHYKGEVVLEDLRSFFSREQIIEFLRVVGYLTPLSGSHDLEVFAKIPFPGIDFEIQDSNWRPTPLLSTSEADSISLCLDDLFSSQNILVYTYSDRQNCQALSFSNFSMNLLEGITTWIRDVETTRPSLFGNDAIFSQERRLEILNHLFGLHTTPLDTLGGRAGIGFLTEKFNTFFFTSLPQSISPLENNMEHTEEILSSLVNIFKTESGLLNGALYQNLIHSFTRSGSLTTELTPYLGKILEAYAEHDDLPEIEGRPLPCAEYFPYRFGVPSCPSAGVIQDSVRGITRSLTVQKDGAPSILSVATKWIAKSEGMRIPYAATYQQRVNFDLLESLRFFWTFGDPRYDSQIVYRAAHHKPQGDVTPVAKNIRLIEKLEITVRDIQFDDGQFGAYFLNELAKSQNYLATLEEKQEMLRMCTKRWSPQCGGWFGAVEKRRMGLNAYAAFDGLMGLGIDFEIFPGKEYNFSRFSQSLFSALVQSSAPTSRRSGVRNFPGVPYPILPDDTLLHDYHLLLKIMNVSGFANISRWVRSRFPTDSREFAAEINSYPWQRLNRNLLSNFDSDLTLRVFHDLIRRHAPNNNGKLYLLLDDAIEWIRSLNFTQTRKLEKVVKNILLLTTYLGNENLRHCRQGCDRILTHPEFSQFTGETVLARFDQIFELILLAWENFKDKDFAMTDALNPLYRVTEALTKALEKTDFNSESRYNIWYSLNKLASHGFEYLFNNRGTVNGYNLITYVLNNKSDDLLNIIMNSYRVLKSLHYDSSTFQTEERDFFANLGRDITTIYNNEDFNFTFLIEYLEDSTNQFSPSFGEPYTLVKSLIKDSPTLLNSSLRFISRDEEFGDFLNWHFSKLRRADN